jgi:hypothetical protein
MEWLKKHFEKVALATALVLLIASAVILSVKVTELSNLVQAPRIFQPKAEQKATPVPLGGYSNALVQLAQPPLWTSTNVNMFHSELEIIQPPSTSSPVIVTNDVPKGPPLYLTQIKPEFFKLIFVSYVGEGHSFQLNFLTFSKTFFIENVGDKVADKNFDTGYVITKFVKTNSVELVPGVGPMTMDRSELTLQKEPDPPLVLTLRRIKQLSKPIGIVHCPDSDRTFNVHPGDTIQCGTNTYNVIDINLKQMIIKDPKSGEKQTITPSGLSR